MGAQITFQGQEEFIELLRQVPDKMVQNIPALLNNYGRKVIDIARNNHHFTSRTNNLENSISLSLEGNRLMIYLDPEFTTTEPSDKWPDGFDYGWGIHDGTKYIEADPFLVRAFEDSEQSFTDALEETIWAILNTI